MVSSRFQGLLKPATFGWRRRVGKGASRRENAAVYLTSLPATNAERLRKGAKATKQSTLALRSYGLLRLRSQ
jgi:hypothetical protein